MWYRVPLSRLEQLSSAPAQLKYALIRILCVNKRLSSFSGFLVGTRLVKLAMWQMISLFTQDLIFK